MAIVRHDLVPPLERCDGQADADKLAASLSECSDVNEGRQLIVDGGEALNIIRSLKPPCEIESTLMRKKRRFESWSLPENDWSSNDRFKGQRDASHMENDIEFWRGNALRSQEAFASFEGKMQNWHESVCLGRHHLQSAVRQCHELNRKLRSDSQRLYSLCEQECGLTNRKRRKLSVLDIVDEVNERRTNIEGSLMKDYEELSAEYLDAVDLQHNTVNSEAFFCVTLKKDDYQIPEQREYCSGVRELHSVGASSSFKSLWDEAGNRSDYISSAAADALEMPIFDCDHPHDSVFNSRGGGGGGGSVGEGGNLGHGSEGVSKAEPGLSNDTADGNNESLKSILQSSDKNTAELSLEESVTKSSEPLEDTAEKSAGLAALCSTISQIEDALFSCDASVTDVQFLFRDPQSWKNVERSRVHLKHGRNSLSEFGARFGQQDRTATTLDSVFGSLRDSESSSVTRSRRRWQSQSHAHVSLSADVECLTTKADARHRYARGVALLLSPLSQYEDRVLGILDKNSRFSVCASGGRGEYACNHPPLPPCITFAEDEVMERCRIQSTAAAANQHIKHMRHRSRDLLKFVADGEVSLKKTEHMLAQLIEEDKIERQRIFEDLMKYDADTAVRGKSDPHPTSTAHIAPPDGGAIEVIGIAPDSKVAGSSPGVGSDQLSSSVRDPELERDDQSASTDTAASAAAASTHARRARK